MELVDRAIARRPVERAGPWTRQELTRVVELLEAYFLTDPETPLPSPAGYG